MSIYIWLSSFLSYLEFKIYFTYNVNFNTNALYMLYAFQHIIILFESQSNSAGQANHSRVKWMMLKDLLLVSGELEIE